VGIARLAGTLCQRIAPSWQVLFACILQKAGGINTQQSRKPRLFLPHFVRQDDNLFLVD